METTEQYPDTQQHLDAPPVVEPQPEPEAPKATDVKVEIVMESFRVVGELFAPGVPRRLVDMLNSNDLTYYTMYLGTLDDPLNPDRPARNFDIIQLHRSGILFAIPREEVHKPDRFEVVRKKPVPSTVVLPGYEVTGNLHLMPDADPKLVPIVSDHHFVPFTDVTVTADKGRSQTWHEPLLIINMARALFYGTSAAGGPA